MRYRNYPVMTADGPVSQAEWKQSGGNIDIYRQLMGQKAMVAEQQAYEKMMLQQQKNYQAAVKSGQINPNAVNNNNAITPIFLPTKGKKKRHGIDESKKVTSDSTASKSATTASAKDAQGKDESTEGSADVAKDAAKPGTTSTTKTAKAKS